MTKDFTKSQKGYIEQIKEDCIKQGRLQAISEFKEKLKERMKYKIMFSNQQVFEIMEKTAQEIEK